MIAHCGLICVSLMISDAEYLLIYLLAIYLFSLEIWQIAQFLIGLFGGFAIRLYELFIYSGY